MSILLGIVTWNGIVASLDALTVKLCPSCMTPDGAHVVSRPLLLAMLLYWIGALVVAAWVAGRVAPRAPVVHALMVAALAMLFFALNAGVAYRSGQDPVWWHVTLVVLALPAGIGGGRASSRSSVGRRRLEKAAGGR